MRKENAGLEWVDWFTKEWESVRIMLLGSMHAEQGGEGTEEDHESPV